MNMMPTHTTHRRNLATPMDPTGKKQPKFTSSTTKPHPTHPDPPLDSCSTIQNISNHFSKLQTQHKALVASLKPSTEKPIPDTSLVKSNRQHRRKTATVVKETLTKSLNQSHEADDIKRALANIKTEGLKKSRSLKEREKNPSMGLTSPNQESELMEQFHGGCETKRSSVLLTKGYGRRRSFCSSQTELADFLSCSGVKVVSSDMPPFMQIHAVDFARKACDSLEKFTARTLASSLKKEFDGIYGPAWHCIVGTSFGSFVTHSVGGFLYFSMDHKMYVLLFKTTVQKAD